MTIGAFVYLNATVTADVDAAVAADKGLVLMGYSLTENAASAAAATVYVVNGATGAATTKVAYIELAANGSETRWFGEAGIYCPLGLSIDSVAGSVSAILYYKVRP